MKILFGSKPRMNSGPDNVNRGMIKNLTDSFTYIKSSNKIQKAFESVYKCWFCDVIVVSGVSKLNCYLVGIAKVLRKKTVYIMHGCVEYESVVDEQQGMEKCIRQEKYLLKQTDLLLPVSEKFMYWVKARYPQYAEKTQYLYNGIDNEELKNVPVLPKIPGSVVAAGADRKIKNNIVTARAVEKMNGAARLEVCGVLYHGIPQEKFEHTKFLGRLPHEEFVKKLAESQFYILNSIYEPYCLTAIEALVCGCSVLITEVAGVTGVLCLEETDIIHDPMNETEIQSKLAYLQDHPNNKRILSQINIDEWSYKKSVERLEQYCGQLLKNK